MTVLYFMNNVLWWLLVDFSVYYNSVVYMIVY